LKFAFSERGIQRCPKNLQGRPCSTTSTRFSSSIIDSPFTIPYRKILEEDDIMDGMSTDSGDSGDSESNETTQSDSSLDKLMELKAGILASRYLGPRSAIPKQTGYRDILFEMPEEGFRQALRMSKPTFDYVLSLIDMHPVFHNNSLNPQMEPRVQLATALERFGCDGNGISTGRVAALMGISFNKAIIYLGIGNGTVPLYTDRTIKAILSLKDEFITWPSDARRKDSSDFFEEEFGIAGAVGIIDGTHIHFHERPHIDGEVFWTRKGRYSVNGTVFLDGILFGIDCMRREKKDHKLQCRVAGICAR
jgi:hypothetical protein